jgi:integrase/recombinase XerC
MSVDEAIRQFKEHLASDPRYAARTQKTYVDEVSLLGQWCTRRRRRLEDVTSDDVNEYVSASAHKKPIAMSTRNRKLTVLRTFFNFLVKTGALTVSPAVTVRFGRVRQREQPTLTAEDVAKVLERLPEAAAAWQTARDVCIITLLFNTGLRLNELIALNVENINVENRVILDVHRKGGDEQPLPLNDWAMEAVSAWLRVRPALDANEPALFVSRLHRRMSDRAIQLMVKEAGRVASFPFLKPHLLRHSFITELLRQGANLEEGKRLAGHRSIRTTSIYAHPAFQSLATAVGRIQRPKPKKNR